MTLGMNDLSVCVSIILPFIKKNDSSFFKKQTKVTVKPREITFFQLKEFCYILEFHFMPTK